MSILLRPTFETNQAPSANNGLVSGVSGRIIIAGDASSQIAARAEGDLNTSRVVFSTFGFKLKRGIQP